MTPEQYHKRRAKLMQAHEDEIRALKMEYIRENNTIKSGDVVSDGVNIIKVDTLTLGNTTRPDQDPYCIYRGPRYTKRGKPYKSGERGSVFQGRIKTVNGVKI